MSEEIERAINANYGKVRKYTTGTDWEAYTGLYFTANKTKNVVLFGRKLINLVAPNKPQDDTGTRVNYQSFPEAKQT